MKNSILLLLLFVFSGISATPAPNFTITSSDNQVLQLYQNYINQGKVVVLEAFFTTCPPCASHAPLVQSLYTQMLVAHPGKVEFILLSTLGTDTNTKVAQYKISKSLTMPAAGSDGGSTTALHPYTSGQFGTFLGTPTFIVIAPNTGEVFFDLRGNSANETLDLVSQKITELLPAPPCIFQNAGSAPLSGVEVKVTTTNFDTTLISNGNYTLKGIPALQGQTCTVNPRKNDNPLDGITTFDLVLISKHILGIQALDCDWQLIAADVNCSGGITTFDIVTARKLLLGIIQDLPCDSWRFVPDSFVTTSSTCMNFLGIKIGDVNGGACNQLNAEIPDRTPFTLGLQDRLLKRGEKAFLDIQATEPCQLEGMQGEFLINDKKLIINQINSKSIPSFDDASFNIQGQNTGRIPFSWLHAEGQSIEKDQPIMTLELTAKEDVLLSEALSLNLSAGLTPQAYSSGNAIRQMELVWENEKPGQAPVSVFPNPTNNIVTVSQVLENDQSVLIQLLDLNGRVVLEKSVEGQSGFNQTALELSFMHAGIYGLRVNGAWAGLVAKQ